MKQIENMSGSKFDLLQALNGKGLNFLMDALEALEDAFYTMQVQVDRDSQNGPIVGLCLTIKRTGAPGAG